MALLTDDSIRTVPVLCNDANSECLVYEELNKGVLEHVWKLSSISHFNQIRIEARHTNPI